VDEETGPAAYRIHVWIQHINPMIWRRLVVPSASTLADPDAASFTFTLNRSKLRKTRRREGRYLLRTNLCGQHPVQLWQFYIQLAEIEAAFKTIKEDLNLRPIFHQLEHCIEAYIFNDGGAGYTSLR
jgi:hypothetical protein